MYFIVLILGLGTRFGVSTSTSFVIFFAIVSKIRGRKAHLSPPTNNRLRNGQRDRCFTHEITRTRLARTCYHRIYRHTRCDCYRCRCSRTREWYGKGLRQYLGASGASVATARYIRYNALHFDCRYILTCANLRITHQRECRCEYWCLVFARRRAEPLRNIHLHEVRRCHATSSEGRRDVC